VSKAPKITPDEYFALLEPSVQTVALEARMCILAAAPELTESMKYGVPFYSYKGMVCYLNVPKAGIVLGFPNATLMSDVYELFSEGNLKRVRHISIPNLAFLAEHHNEIHNYLIEAMVLNDGKNRK
jgi:hypothetical protein